ncbi:MAG: amino acid ABC transporter permease, partial [Proteobacteria bacterium]|nr:amino acid ABC transporter permease [Pseudomonadota bacterium]
MKRLLLSLLLLIPNADAKEPLRWAADTESGAPYVFQDPRNPNRLMGFEFDIIQKIAQKL